jgi:hypothetical protein
MSLRTPPRPATWLLHHLGPSYRRESLAGDLYEEYQLNRTQAWYWRQVLTAIWIAQAMRARKFVRRSKARYKVTLSFLSVGIKPLSRRVSRLVPGSGLLSGLATSGILRFSTEGAALIGALALAEQFRRACSSGGMSDTVWMVTLVAGIGLCMSIGSYLSLCRFAARRRTAAPRRNTPIKRLMGVFAVTALSAGTLTWASGTSHLPQQCTNRGKAELVSVSSSGQSDLRAH